MSTSSNKKSETAMDDVLALISDLKAGSFSKQLNKTSDPKLKDLVDGLNDLTKILAAQAQAQAQVGDDLASPILRMAELRTVFETMSDGLVIQDSAGKILQFNPAALSALGLTEEQLLGRTSVDSRWQAVREDGTDFPGQEHPAMVALRTGNKVMGVVMGIQLPSGAQHWLRINATPFDSKGDPTHHQAAERHVITTFTNITAIRKIESNAELSFQRLEDAQATAKIGSWDFDLNSHNLNWSSEHFNIFEIPKPQSQKNLYKLYRERIHPDDVKELDRLVERATITGEDFIFNHRLVFDNGKRIKHVQGIGKVHKDKSGKPISISGTCQDLTDSKSLQDENRFILDALGIGLWKFNPADRSLFWDKSMYQLFDVKEDDFSGHYQAWESTLTPESKAKAVEELGQALRGENEFDTVFEIQTKAKGKRFISGRGKVIRDNSGNPIMMYGVNTDVTKNRIQELQLTASKAQLEKAEAMAKIGNWELNLATYQGYWSKGQLALFGLDYHKGAPSFEDFMGFVHPDDRSLISTEFENILKNKVKEFQLVFRIILPDGKTVRWMKELGELLLTQDGVPDRLVGTIQDITEEKLSGDRIEGLKNQLEVISDNMPGPVSQVDRHGRFVYASKMYFEYFGKSPEQILGKTHRELLPPNVFLQAEPNIKRALSGERVRYEMPFVTASGKKLFVQINMIPFTGQDRKPDGFLTVISDITDLKQAEEKLIIETAKIQDEKLSEMMRITSATPSCLKIITDKGLLVHMNPQGLNLIEADNFESVLNANVYEIVAEPHREAFIKFNEKICSGEKGSLIFEIVGLKGARHWMETFAAPYTLPNGEIGHVAITNRITDRVNSQKELDLQKNKLLVKSKLESLGEMSAGIAHEINNPLAIIDGSANHLLKFANDPEKLNSKLQNIKMAVVRISKIVSGLKKFSSSGEKTVYANHSISALLVDVLTLVEVKPGRENVAIKIETKTNAQIFCNSIEIEQVLINLISNAIDAVKSLPERWVNVSTHDDGKSVVLRVTDSGAGIPANIRDKLFNPFFTTKPTGEGTGLGLSISKGILDEHKASISVLDSSPNTCFEIRFHKVEIANAS